MKGLVVCFAMLIVSMFALVGCEEAATGMGVAEALLRSAATRRLGCRENGRPRARILHTQGAHCRSMCQRQTS